jgi:hypothetical protein
MNKLKTIIAPKYAKDTIINHDKHGKCKVLEDTGNIIKIIDEKGKKHTFERYS